MKQNNFPDICDFEMRLQNNPLGEREYDCLSDLRIRVEEVNLDGDECKVCFVKATIAMVLEGFEPISGSRYGEPKKENVVERIEKNSKSLSAAGEVSGKANLSSSFESRSGNASLSLMASSTQINNLTTESTSFTNHYRVKAVTNLKWEVTEPDGSLLSETYLESDRLIALRERLKTNRRYISVDVSVKQRDLSIEASHRSLASGVLNRLTNNQKKLFDIFVAKSINSKIPGSATYSGAIKMSQFTFDSTNGDFDE